MSWVGYNGNTDFPIENLPFGIFHLKTENEKNSRVGVAIGDFVIDMQKLFLVNDNSKNKCFTSSTLNEFISNGYEYWKYIRELLLRYLETNIALKYMKNVSKALIPMSKVLMCMPVNIKNYTDFNSSIHHAKNIGRLYRPTNPLFLNWLMMPIGYNGRCSSIVVSKTEIKRPSGQFVENGELKFGKTKKLDFELEIGAIIGKSSDLGTPISIDNAHEYIFGFVLLNDWSARDIQSFECQPLGPLNGKNFATTISPWIISTFALEEFRTKNYEQKMESIDYLKESKENSAKSMYDIDLEILINDKILLKSNSKYLYWSFAQQITHLTSNGCNIQVGDLIGSGTISGPSHEQCGSLLEYTLDGSKPFIMNNSEQTFLQDKDVVTMRGYCSGNGYKIGFGKCEGQIC